jgi:hypothetical protein
MGPVALRPRPTLALLTVQISRPTFVVETNWGAIWGRTAGKLSPRMSFDGNKDAYAYEYAEAGHGSNRLLGFPSTAIPYLDALEFGGMRMRLWSKLPGEKVRGVDETSKWEPVAH